MPMEPIDTVPARRRRHTGPIALLKRIIRAFQPNNIDKYSRWIFPFVRKRWKRGRNTVIHTVLPALQHHLLVVLHARLGDDGRGGARRARDRVEADRGPATH